MSAAAEARANNTTVRRTEAADVDAVSRMLARAFFDDPVMMHFLPNVFSALSA